MEDKKEFLKYIKQSFELKNQKLYKEAIEVLYKVLNEENDKDTLVEVISQIGDLHILLKNYDRAIEQYENVLEVEPNHKHSKNKLFDIYFETGEYEKALSAAVNLCNGSGDADDFVKYFSVLYKMDKNAEIVSKYENLTEDIKNSPKIMYIISHVLPQRKKELLIKTVEAAPDFLEAKFDLGMIYYDEGNFDDALKYFDDILKRKKDAQCFYYKALIQISKKEFFKGIDNLHHAIKADRGENQEFYFELAKAYMDINWFEEAINTIKRSITLCIQKGEQKSVIDERYLLLAWVFEKQKDFDNALFNLTLIDINSTFKIQSDILKALIAYEKGDIIAAKTAFENLYENCPASRGDPTLLSTLGEIYKDLKLNKQGCEFYEKHLAEYPDSLHTACEYVDLLIDLEEYDRAEEVIKKYSNAGKVPSFLNSRARIFFRKKEYARALDALNELLSYDKNNAETYYFKGLVLNTTGDFTGAIECIETALKLNPLPAKYYAQCAYAYFMRKMYKEAMLYIREAIEIEPNDLNYKKQAAEIAKESGENADANFWNAIVNRTETIIKENKRF